MPKEQGQGDQLAQLALPVVEDPAAPAGAEPAGAAGEPAGAEPGWTILQELLRNQQNRQEQQQARDQHPGPPQLQQPDENKEEKGEKLPTPPQAPEQQRPQPAAEPPVKEEEKGETQPTPPQAPEQLRPQPAEEHPVQEAEKREKQPTLPQAPEQQRPQPAAENPGQEAAPEEKTPLKQRYRSSSAGAAPRVATAPKTERHWNFQELKQRSRCQSSTGQAAATEPQQQQPLLQQQPQSAAKEEEKIAEEGKKEPGAHPFPGSFGKAASRAPPPPAPEQQKEQEAAQGTQPPPPVERHLGRSQIPGARLSTSAYQGHGVDEPEALQQALRQSLLEQQKQQEAEQGEKQQPPPPQQPAPEQQQKQQAEQGEQQPPRPWPKVPSPAATVNALWEGKDPDPPAAKEEGAADPWAQWKEKGYWDSEHRRWPQKNYYDSDEKNEMKRGRDDGEGWPPKKGGGKGGGKNVVCFQCGGSGHFARDCDSAFTKGGGKAQVEWHHHPDGSWRDWGKGGGGKGKGKGKGKDGEEDEEAHESGTKMWTIGEDGKIWLKFKRDNKKYGWITEDELVRAKGTLNDCLREREEDMKESGRRRAEWAPQGRGSSDRRDSRERIRGLRGRSPSPGGGRGSSDRRERSIGGIDRRDDRGDWRDREERFQDEDRERREQKDHRDRERREAAELQEKGRRGYHSREADEAEADRHNAQDRRDHHRKKQAEEEAEKREKEIWEAFAWELKGWDKEDEELERKRPYSAFGGQKSLDQIIDSARRLATKERTKKGTWAICPGCWKEIGADDDADGRSRFTKHLADRSANEYLSGETDPDKIWHLTKLFWKQIMAIEKKLVREQARLQGR